MIRFFYLICLFLTSILFSLDLKAETTPVKLQLKWKHQFQFAGYYAAKEKGFYEEAGLDVKILEAVPGVDPVVEVIVGNAQFGVGTSELILNRYHGSPVIVLGVIFQHSPLSLITLFESGIDNVHKLAGRKIMIELSSAELFAYLSQEGLSQNKFTLQHHSFDFNDLLTGKTDAISVYVTDELYEAKRRNLKYNHFTPRMGGVDFYGDNFFTMEKEVKENPQIVAAFKEATEKGWRYAMHNREEIIQLIYNKYSKRHSIEHLRFEANTMYDLMQPELIDPGYMNPGRWQHISQTYHKLGLLPEKFNVDAMLYVPDSIADLKKLREKLYYAAFGLSLLTLISVMLFRFYRTARISESRLKIMLDNAPVSIIVLNDKNQVQTWNTEAENTFLWNSKDMLGQNILKIVPSREQEEVEQVLSDVHKNFTVSHHQNANIRKDGKEILCEWMNAPFKGKYDNSNFVICMARDITEKKRLQQELEHAAHYDSLTSLPNRALILDHFKKSIAIAARRKSKLAVLFLDLNGFKDVNDSLGHEAGDVLLKTIAERLKLGIRESDYVGRLGGDEFLVILTDIETFANANLVAKKLKELISQMCNIKNVSIHITTSIGISMYPDDATELNDLIHHADQRMYQIKKEESKID